MRPVPYAKMNGIGNSILVVDFRGTGLWLSGDQARTIGLEPRLHFDQLMAINDPETSDADAFVDIFNIDGSRAGACGNGTRCVAWMMHGSRHDGPLRLATRAGVLLAEALEDGTYRVDMGPPRLGWDEIPLRYPVTDTADVILPDAPDSALARFSAVSMGNPHAVFFVREVGAIDLSRVGPLIEHNPVFPDRVNVSFACIRTREEVELRVWERGAGATLACGSAACASVVAAVRAGLTERQVRVSLPGGNLVIAWRAADGHVLMTGGVTLEHEGVLSPALLGLAT